MDTEQLTEGTASKIRSLLEEAQLFDREQKVVSDVQGAADFFSYQLKIDRDGRKKSFLFSDVNAPDEVRPLLDYLRNLAIEQKMKGNQ
jgi:hypothetical protein